MTTIPALFAETIARIDPEATVIRWVDSRLRMTPISWRMLERESNRRANFLTRQGVRKGARVFLFLNSSIEIWYFFWGALKIGAVPCVLFPDFGAEALKARLDAGQVNFLITDGYPAKFEAILAQVPSLQRVICLSAEGADGADAGTRLPAAWFDAAAEISDDFQPVEIAESDPAFIVFTSGSTGFPKAVVHAHHAAAAILRSMTNVLHVTARDVYWCTAHPAWVTGTVYGVIGPLLAGVESVQYAGNFHAKRWLPILQDQRVTVWYSAPTAFRSMMAAPAELFKQYDLSQLKNVFSIGEPLNPAVFHWGQATLQRPILDTWFQTEAGTIRIANQPGDDIRPGYMGWGVDDAQPSVLNEQNEPCAVDEVGKLCLKTGWGSCFIGYFGQDTATASKFQDGFYQTGDLALLDAEGRLCFVGRDDDVINTSGHLVGPFEVESVLLEDPAVVEAGVVAAPDPLLYEKVAAFIELREGEEWTDALETRLRVAVTTGLSAHATPKVFYVVKSLPKNAAGKILRNELRKIVQEQTSKPESRGMSL